SPRSHSRTDNLGSQRHDGPVVVDVSQDVEVVGEDVEGEVGYELADLLVGHPGLAGRLDVGVIDVAGVVGDVVGQFQQRRHVRVVRLTFACAVELGSVHLGDVGAGVGVRGKAVLAAVELGGG